MLENLPDAFSGEVLKLSILSPLSNRKYIAEGLLYDKTMLMVSADPGTGKSMIGLQVACQLATGVPLFGALQVPEPVKVYYIQKERPFLEVQERLALFFQTLDINFDNLVIDSAIQFINLSNLRLADELVRRISKHKPKVIVIDPIGAGLGGLTKDEVANNFCAMLNYIQSIIGNSYWLNHHTTKQQYTQDGERIDKEKPFYGSQWLDAMVTGHYHLTQTEKGTHWRRTKDTLGTLLKHFDLWYDPETQLSTLAAGSMTARDKVNNFINSIKEHKQSFTFSELKSLTGVSDSILRDTLKLPSISSRFTKVKSIGEATLYKIII